MGNKAEDVIRMKGHTRSYIRQYAVHDPAVIKKPELLDGSQYFKLHFIGTNITGLSTSKFLDDLMNYEADHQIKGNRKKRYGKMFDILMPKGSWDDETLLKIAKAFWKRLVQKESGLKFIAWKFYSGQPRKENRTIATVMDDLQSNAATLRSTLDQSQVDELLDAANNLINELEIYTKLHLVSMN